jgi:hypothetical protein
MITLNDVLYKIPYQKYYLSSLLIDVKEKNMKCNMKNKILIFCEDPRSNISSIHAYFEFFFTMIPKEYTLGQVMSRVLISYTSIDTMIPFHHLRHDYMNCVLFTIGFNIKEILIYMPKQTFPFFRELKYYFFPQENDTCSICLEKKRVINVHKDKFHHYICLSCITRLQYPLCPLCRQLIL